MMPSTQMKHRSRTVAPAELTRAAVEAKFEAYLELMKTRDMSSLMKELRKEISWKCAPQGIGPRPVRTFILRPRGLGTWRGAPSEKNGHGFAGGPSPPAN